MMISCRAASRRYRDRSSFTLASATSRLGFAERCEPLGRFGFGDDGEDLDFLADDVMVHPELIHAETVLRSIQPANVLDSTLGRLHRLMPKMHFERGANGRPVVGRERRQLPFGRSGE